MTVLRPAFADGAILAAADLSSLEDTGRDRDARHARHLHTPGISHGMALTTQDRTTADGAPYKDVTLTSGYAVDGTGRELVLADALPLSPDRFLGDNPNPTTEPGDPSISVWHPVFVRGVDSDVPSAGGFTGCQAAGGSARVGEDVEVEFGRPGDTSAGQPEPAPDAGPGDGSWRVLVGFVRFNTQLQRFAAVAAQADGVRADAAGARAGVVAAPGSRVEIRGGPAPDSGIPAVVVDAANGGTLVYGRHDGTGGLTPLMTVDGAGNLTVSGTLKGTLTAGTVRMVGGTAFDGTVLPLPAGVTADDIGSGNVDAIVHVTPRLPDLLTAPAGTGLYLPAECRVDTDRRVHCSGRWIGMSPFSAGPLIPGACDYLMLVTTSGGGA